VASGGSKDVGEKEAVIQGSRLEIWRHTGEVVKYTGLLVLA